MKQYYSRGLTKTGEANITAGNFAEGMTDSGLGIFQACAKGAERRSVYRAKFRRAPGSYARA